LRDNEPAIKEFSSVIDVLNHLQKNATTASQVSTDLDTRLNGIQNDIHRHREQALALEVRFQNIVGEQQLVTKQMLNQFVDCRASTKGNRLYYKRG